MSTKAHMKILRHGCVVRCTKEMTPTRKWDRILILDSNFTTCFGVLREKGLCHYDEHRTKLQILDIYERMQHVVGTGEPYQTLLDPPPDPPTDETGTLLPEGNPGHPKPPNWPPRIHPPKEVS